VTERGLWYVRAVRFSRVVSGSILLALGACGGARAGDEGSRLPPPVATAKVAAPTGAPRLASAAIAQVPGGTFGPYLGMGAHGGLSVWASAEANGRGWFARAVNAQGRFPAESVRIADAPNELGLVTVRAFRDDFALLATHKTSDGEVIELSLLSAAGARLAGPVAMGRALSDVLWVELMPSAHGATILWAASNKGRAEIWAANVSERGALRDNGRLLTRDVGAWQAVPFGAGFALGVTHVGKESTQHGPIELLQVGDGEAAPITTVVNAETTADLDLDLAPLGAQIVLAWSDHRGGENRVFSASVDAQGKLTAAPAPATAPLGEQALLRVIGSPDGKSRAYLAWEDLSEQGAQHRSFQVAAFEPSGRVSGVRGRFEYWKMDGSVPEIATSAAGVSVLTLAPICLRGEECQKSAPIVPAFVSFDQNFALTANEPLRLEGRPGAAALAWNLTCPTEACFSLTAEHGVPSNIALAKLEHRSDSFRAPAERVELPPPPRIVSDEALAETEPLARIALSSSSAGNLLGWLSDFDPTTPWVKLKKATADGRFEPLRAHLDLQLFGASAPYAALAGPENLSLRAHSLGGISLTSDATKAETLVAWAGLDGGQPQVFLTQVDKVGKKLAQRMLTHKTGDLGDITTLGVGPDYLVAWVDERSGDPELYATKVNHALNRVAPEQRLTEAPGSATDLSLVTTHSGVLAVWADARETEHPGWADIYTAALRPNDASRIAPEICVQKTRAHSFSPVARANGKNTLVAWLEAVSEAGDEPAHVSFAELDDSGKLVGDVQNVALPSGSPATLGLDCAEHEPGCHALVTVESSGRAELLAISYRGGKASSAVRVQSSSGAPSSVPPVIHGREAYVADQREGRGHVRRLLLDW